MVLSDFSHENFETETHEKLRYISALLLVCAFFLPLTQCSTSTSTSTVVPDEASEETTSSITHVFTPSDNFNFTEMDSYLLLAIFFWPVLFFLLSFKLKKFFVYQDIFQIIGSLFTGYFLFAWSSFGEWMFGLYVGFTGVAGLMVAAAQSLLTRVKNIRNNVSGKSSKENEGNALYLKF